MRLFFVKFVWCDVIMWLILSVCIILLIVMGGRYCGILFIYMWLVGFIDRYSMCMSILLLVSVGIGVLMSEKWLWLICFFGCVFSSNWWFMGVDMMFFFNCCSLGCVLDCVYVVVDYEFGGCYEMVFVGCEIYGCMCDVVWFVELV